MADDWRKGFHRAVVDTVLRLGDPTKPGHPWELTTDNWRDYTVSRNEMRTDIARIGIDYDRTTFEESDWEEFKGTFYEGDTRVYGIDMILVLLDATQYRWRYGRRLSEFLLEVIKYEE